MNYQNEPAVIDGDFVKSGGDYKRVCHIENAIRILVGTKKGYWGNTIEPPASKIPGGLEEFDGIAITSTTLSRYAARVTSVLQPLITNGLAEKITVNAYNVHADRIDWTAEIFLKNGDIYKFDTIKGVC